MATDQKLKAVVHQYLTVPDLLQGVSAWSPEVRYLLLVAVRQGDRVAYD